jgi:hypothetical protein
MITFTAPNATFSMVIVMVSTGLVVLQERTKQAAQHYLLDTATITHIDVHIVQWGNIHQLQGRLGRVL